MQHARPHDEMVKEDQPAEFLVSLAPNGPEEKQRIFTPPKREWQAHQKQRVKEWHRVFTHGIGEAVRMLAKEAALTLPVEERTAKLSLGRSPIVLNHGVLDPPKSVALIRQSPGEIDVFRRAKRFVKSADCVKCRS